MKTKHVLRALQAAAFAACLLLSFAHTSRAQTSTVPFVTIRATDPYASETNNHPGEFTVYRVGPTNNALNVFYLIGGTASNGVDYATLPNWVYMPAGTRTATITVMPIDDKLVEPTETVELQLSQPPGVPPTTYIVGSPSNAVVYIADNDSATTNIPPRVSIFSPTNGAVFFAPVNIDLFAKASDADGSVTNVEFFDGTNDLGRGLLGVLDPPGAPVGSHTLTAVATDNGGASTTSDPVYISVRQGPPPPPTNFPPVVRIVSPPNGAIFRAPMSIPIYAYAHDLDDAVATVEFFANGNSQGFGSQIPCTNFTATCTNCTVRPCPTNIYFLVWSNPAPGTYALTAKATDTRGAATLSEPVNITVLSPVPPPTNRPPVVNIVATDPIAIEGTNCYPWAGLTNSTPTWDAWCTNRAFCRTFTNCGPKNATFTVHRFGATNDPLTINYAIGGTATNGMDYVTLPGFVTIPAGEHSAVITVVPIDDGPPDITSTVVLKLKPDTNYIIGLPARAAAIILDGPFLPRTTMLPGACFHLSANGPDAAWFRVEYSSDLVNWTPICTTQVVHGSIDFVDPDAQNDQHRFYRAVPSASGPW
ncbi:MAG: hypothetical protein DME25_09150 [Verrucomicrobia bacterium]|nr:MAG: hypothetical protein DME25_09150 [Verrucomicrobiota bacterium]